MIPDCNRSSKFLVEKPINTNYETTKTFTYVIEPHEYAAKRYPLSDIESAVGELRPKVSNLTGFEIAYRLSILNSPSDVLKKNTYGSEGSNSISMPYVRSPIEYSSITFGYIIKLSEKLRTILNLAPILKLSSSSSFK